jgi:predicted phage terminase large subunit-like protein
MIAEKKKLNKLEQLIELGRQDFYSFCRLTAPDFYKKDRIYLKNLCDKLNEFYYDPTKKRLKIHMPPRHGKTRTIINFVSWIFGKDKNNCAMVSTYNETLSGRLGKDIRDMIATKNFAGNKFSYNLFFSDTEVNPKDSSKTLWSLKGRHFNFLATSPKGTATGIGANFIIIDDIIKNHLEALNSRHKEELWEWYINTLQSRMEVNSKVIVVNTRWAVDDLGGRLHEAEPDLWEEIVYPIYDENQDQMLCEEIKTKEEFFLHREKAKVNAHSYAIFQANYFQIPVSTTLSNSFSNIPIYYEDIINYDNVIGYIDVANGGDYLCFVAAKIKDNSMYLSDVLYIQDTIDVTVPQITEILNKYKHIRVRVETNGAIGFMNYLQEKIHRGVSLEPIQNRKSKQLRINNCLISAINYFHFPELWWSKWTNFYNDLITYNPRGKNKHDDAPDALAGLLDFFIEDFDIINDNFKGWEL